MIMHTLAGRLGCCRGRTWSGVLAQGEPDVSCGYLGILLLQTG